MFENRKYRKSFHIYVYLFTLVEVSDRRWQVRTREQYKKGEFTSTAVELHITSLLIYSSET